MVQAACRDDDPAPRLIVYEAATQDSVNVYTIDARTDETTQITDYPKFNGNPAWSPDRRRIIYASNRETDGPHELYVMDADGAHERRLTETTGSEWSPKYSPDGKHVAYVLQEDGAGWSVWIMGADGTGARKLTRDYAFAEFPAWAPGGQRLVYSARDRDPAADIFAVDIETGEITTVIARPGTDVCPQFASDGKTMTYGSQGDGGGDINVYARDVASGDTSGAADRRLTDAPERDDYANWGPDDETLVFVSRRDGNGELYLMNADGSDQRRLTNTPDLRENVPDW